MGQEMNDMGPEIGKSVLARARGGGGWDWRWGFRQGMLHRDNAGVLWVAEVSAGGILRETGAGSGMGKWTWAKVGRAERLESGRMW